VDRKPQSVSAVGVADSPWLDRSHTVAAAPLFFGGLDPSSHASVNSAAAFVATAVTNGLTHRRPYHRRGQGEFHPALTQASTRRSNAAWLSVTSLVNIVRVMTTPVWRKGPSRIP